MYMTKRKVSSVLLTSFLIVAMCIGFLVTAPMPVQAAVHDTVTVDGVKYQILNMPGYDMPTTPNGRVNVGDNRYYSGNPDVVIPEIITVSGTSENDGSYLVVGVADAAFLDNTHIQSVSIPRSAEVIGEAAFDSCAQLASVTLAEGVQTIGVGAFAGTALTSLTLPSSITTIATYAFTGCTSLSRLVFRGAVPTMGTYTFENLPSTGTLYFPSGQPGYEAALFTGYLEYWTFTATTAPSFTPQPSNQNVNTGDPASFTAVAVATGDTSIAYQWQESQDGGGAWNNISDGGVYSGATTDTLSLQAVPSSYNGYQYRCVASNLMGTGTSNAALLTVIVAVQYPVISNFPVVTDKSATNIEAEINGDYIQFFNGGSLLGSVVNNTTGGNTLAETTHFTHRLGSTIITLTPAYLNTLSNGTYQIRVNFAGGNFALLSLVVAVPSSGGTTTGNPKTADDMPLGLFISLIAITGAVLIVRRKFVRN
jgi:sortase B cell surface sorting signal